MRSRYGSSDVRSSYRTAGAKTTYLQLPAQLAGADQEPVKRFSSPLKRGRGMTPYEQRRMEAAFAGTCLAAVHANARSRGAGTRTAANPDQVGDRKSIAEGTSVYVCVVLGGCGIIKQKKTKKHTNNTK